MTVDSNPSGSVACPSRGTGMLVFGMGVAARTIISFCTNYWERPPNATHWLGRVARLSAESSAPALHAPSILHSAATDTRHDK